jgi:hypothetical protein
MPTYVARVVVTQTDDRHHPIVEPPRGIEPLTFSLSLAA